MELYQSWERGKELEVVPRRSELIAWEIHLEING